MERPKLFEGRVLCVFVGRELASTSSTVDAEDPPRSVAIQVTMRLSDSVLLLNVGGNTFQQIIVSDFIKESPFLVWGIRQAFDEKRNRQSAKV